MSLSTSNAFTKPDTVASIRKLTETTQSVYDPVLGLLTGLIEHDGQTTYLAYFENTVAQNAEKDRSDQVPALGDLLKSFKLEASETPLLDVMALCCPTISDSTAPPLMAQYEYLQLPDPDVRSNMALTLYGYANASQSAQGVLIPDTVLRIEGIEVDRVEVPWKVTLGTGRKGLIVNLQQRIQTRSQGKYKTETITTRWYKDNSARETRSMTQTSDYDATAGHRVCRSTSSLTLENRSRNAVLTQQVCSARSGRVLRETRQDELGRPVTVIRHDYDAAGRSVGSTTYAWGDAKIDVERPAGLPIEGDRTEWVETSEGTWVRTRGPDGRHGRTLLDGLQRPVRRELQRVIDDSHADANYVRIEELAYGVDDKVCYQCTYDYLPGGQCVRNEGAVLPTHLHSWFWQVQAQTLERNADQGDVLTTQTVTGTLAEGSWHRLTTTQRNHNDGQVTQIRRQECWSANRDPMQSKSRQTQTTLDARGYICKVSESHQVGSEHVDRTWKCDYDELGRRVRLTTADQRKVEWQYEGLKTVPTQIFLTGPDGRQQLLGKQEFETNTQGQAVVARTVGGAESKLKSSVKNAKYQRPDGTQIWSELSDDGGTLSWYTEAASNGATSSKQLVASFAYNQVTQVLHGTRTLQSVGADNSIRSESAMPNLLGTYLSTRHVRGVRLQQQYQRSLRGASHIARCASGLISRTWQDPQQRVSRTRRGGLEYRYRHGPQGELERLTIFDLRTGRGMSVSMTYDGMGREIQRTYRLDGVVKSRYEQDWSGAGQLLSKRWYRNGEAEPTRSESFTYERLRNELQKWSVQAVEGYAIEDASGRAIKTQSYSYDALGNVRTCVTTYEEGQVETRNYQYDDTMQPTQRTAVLGDDPKAVISLEVDANGSLTKNAHGQTLSYSHDGQLISVEQGGLLMSRYEYDEQGRLATQWDEAQKQFRVLEYEEDRLCGERWLDAKGTPVRHKILDEETGLVVHCTDVGKERDVTKTFFLLSDPQAAGGEQFSIDEHGEWESQAIGFTPWGEAPLQRLNAMASGMGYNAQRVDPVTGFYHLGNGYRVYDPHHQAFYQSDSLSPFGEGGLNDRAYCAGHDPINWHDPSGHIMISRREQNENLASLDEMIRDTTPPYHEPVPWWEYAILGGVFILSVAASVMTGGAAGALILAVAAASTALGAAALAIQHTNPKLSEKLNLAATLVGLADLAVNLGTALAKGAAKWAKAAWTASRSVRNAVKLGSVKLLKHVTSGVKAFRGSGTRLLERTAADIASPSRIERSMVTWGGSIESPHSVYYSSNPGQSAKIWIAEDLYNVGPAFQKNIGETKRVASSLTDIIKDVKAVTSTNKPVAQNVLTDLDNAIARATTAKDKIVALDNDMKKLVSTLATREHELQIQLDNVAQWDKTKADWDELMGLFGGAITDSRSRRSELLKFMKAHSIKPTGYDALKSRSILDPTAQNATVIKEAGKLINDTFDAHHATQKILSTAQKVAHDEVRPLLARLAKAKSEVEVVLNDLHTNMKLYALSLPSPGRAQALTAHAKVLADASALNMQFAHPLRRLKLMFHGRRPMPNSNTGAQAVVQFPPGSGPALNSYWDAPRMHRELTRLKDASGNALIDFKSFDVIQLNMCHGAAGGRVSFAQDFANLTGVPVKGYAQSLMSNYSVDNIEKIAQSTYKAVNASPAGNLAPVDFQAALKFVTEDIAGSVFLRSVKLPANPARHNVNYQPQWLFPVAGNGPTNHAALKAWLKSL